MVKLWQGEAAGWRLELDMGGEALTLRMKEEGRALAVGMGDAPTPETREIFTETGQKMGRAVGGGVKLSAWAEPAHYT